MRLLIDSGNSRLKWAMGNQDGLHLSGQLSREEAESEGLARMFARLDASPSSIWVANVAGVARQRAMQDAGGGRLRERWHFVVAEAECLGLRNAYRIPAQLGVDRWVAMLAAFRRLGGPLCVVDAGTALTVDAVDAHGQHLGGVIVPGLQMMKNSLRKDTSDIDQRAGGIDAAGGGLFARSTLEAISFGSLLALAGLVERAVAETGAVAGEPRLVLTGGDAVRLADSCKLPHQVIPDLVLEGLNLMAENVS